MLKKSLLVLMFVIAAIVCEIVTFALMNFGALFPTYNAINLSFVFFIAGALMLIPFVALTFTLTCLLVIIQVVLSFANVILYKVFGDVFSIDLLTLIPEAQAAGGSGFLGWAYIWPFLLIIGIFLLLQVLILTFVKFKPVKQMTRQRKAVILAAVFVVFCIGSPVVATANVSILPNDRSQTLLGVTVRDNYENLSFKNSFFKDFGTFTLIFHNVILGKAAGEVLKHTTNQDVLNYFNGVTKQEILDAQGQYFGIDSGNNVLTIMTESFDTFMVHPVYTPTYHKLLYGSDDFDRGFNFGGFYAYQKTDVTETSFILGNYPSTANMVADFKNGGDQNKDSRNQQIAKEFPFSVPNVLKEDGREQANYFIAHNGRYYSRQFSHLDFGFDDVFFNEDYPTNTAFIDYTQYINSWSMPEEYFVSSALEDMLPTDKSFYSHFSTINPHGTYGSLYPNDWHIRDGIAAINLEYLKFEVSNKGAFSAERSSMSNGQFNMFLNAMAKAMVADRGLAYIFEELENREGINANGETGKLIDITTVLLFTDHAAYIDDLAFFAKQTSKQNPESYRVPAAIWSKNISALPEEEKTIEKFINTFDLVPTLFDILGITINPRIYVGTNAFTDGEGVIISRLGPVFNADYLSNGLTLLFSRPGTTAQDLENFKQNYLKFVEKWQYTNRLLLRGNEMFFDSIYKWTDFFD
ncbi:MAG: sulfatase-like hydrolase/transferase, partial [Firmicutes bacterium]|nr:sulfatase-like hydrolase/transferase [Bacillota bacterium]